MLLGQLAIHLGKIIYSNPTAFVFLSLNYFT